MQFKQGRNSSKTSRSHKSEQRETCTQKQLLVRGKFQSNSTTVCLSIDYIPWFQYGEVTCCFLRASFMGYYQTYPRGTLYLDVSLFCYQHTDTSYGYHHHHHQHLCYACQSVQHDQRYSDRDCSGMTRAERVLHDYYLCFFLFPASEEREKELLVSLWEKFQQWWGGFVPSFSLWVGKCQHFFLGLSN